MKNNIHVKTSKILGIGYGDICICEECAVELKARPNYDGTVDFEKIEEDL